MLTFVLDLDELRNCKPTVFIMFKKKKICNFVKSFSI